MSFKFYNYYVISALKTQIELNEYDILSGNFTLNLDTFDKLFGEGAAKYLHDNNTNLGDMILQFEPELDILEFSHFFMMAKANSTAGNFSLTIYSSDTDYNVYSFFTEDRITKINKWTKIKIAFDDYQSHVGTLDFSAITKIKFSSTTANLEIKLNFLCAALETFEFESNITDVLQEISHTSATASINLPILGRNGGITISQGTLDEEQNIPVFLKGDNAFQNMLKLKNLKIAEKPLLFEYENYGFLILFIDNISNTNISKEISENSFRTQIELTIQSHSFNND